MSTYWQNTPKVVDDTRCSCICGCTHVLSRHEMQDAGEVCDACYGEPGHLSLTKGK